jgi:membrane protein
MSKKSRSVKGFRELTWTQRKRLVRETISEFLMEKGLFHGAALSYYTIFAMVPIIYLSIVSFGSIIGQKTMIEIITKLLHEQVGIEDVSGIISFLNTVNFEKGSLVLQLVGIVALLISSTAIFTSLKGSINTFFDIERKYDTKRKQLVSNLLSRLVSIALLALAASVIIITYFAQLFLLSFAHKLVGDLNGIAAILMAFINHIVSILSTTLIFGFVFKYLHDGVILWRLAWTGSLVTAVLMYFGQLLIQFYLSHFFFAKDGGIAGAILVILAFMYYSSQMIFLGAKFTAIYARLVGHPIRVKGSKKSEMKTVHHTKMEILD